MKTKVSRRQFPGRSPGWSAASIALGEFGLSQRAPGRGELHAGLNRRNSGATGLRASFVDVRPNSRRRPASKVSQEFAIDSVFTAKAMASCGTPPFSTLAVLQAEANFLALGGCLQDYDLDVCKNYKDIVDSAKEPPRGQLKNWFTPFVLIVMGLVYNTKEASKPTSYQDLLNPNIQGTWSASRPMAGSGIPGSRC